MSEDKYREHAETMVEPVIPIIRSILEKHWTAALEEMHNRIRPPSLPQEGEVDGRWVDWPKLPVVNGCVTVPIDVLNTCIRLLDEYASQATYMGQRTGGVLKGCPRGPAPTPRELATRSRINRNWIAEKLQEYAALQSQPVEGDKDLQRYLAAFGHTHVNKQDGTDSCAMCDLDLRDPIHFRVGESQQTRMRAMTTQEDG